MEKYLESKETQEKHLKYLKTIRNDARIPENFKPKIQRVDLDWLKNEISSISKIRDICQNSALKYEYGIVYAIKFKEKDLSILDYHNFMGIKALSCVSKENIIGKVKVPSHFKYEGFHNQTNNLSRKILNLKLDENSLIHRLLPSDIKSRIPSIKKRGIDKSQN